MKIVIQRVSRSSVSVDGEVVGAIEAGLMVLCGFGKDDDESKLKPMAEKLCNLRIFPDAEGRFHYSVLETTGAVLLVPQFTLYADTTKGRRPAYRRQKRPFQPAQLRSFGLALQKRQTA